MLWIVFALLLWTCLPAFAATAPEDEAKYKADLDEGISILKQGDRDDISRAIAKFKNALKIKPESAEAYYWIALAYSDQGNYPRAVGNAKDATVYGEDIPEAWLLWGQILLYQRDWNAALEKLEIAQRLAPDNPQIQFNLGRVHYHGFKNPDAALPKFRAVWQKSQALRHENPELQSMVVRSRLYMGYCEFERKRWDNAINAFLDVLKEQPDNYDASLMLAIAYRHTNRSGESKRILDALLANLMNLNNPAYNQLLSEVNLQLADLYIKDPIHRNRMFALAHLNEFINRLGTSSHPMLESVREYIAIHDSDE